MLWPIKLLISKVLIWQETEITGTTVTQMHYQEAGWTQARRLILLRHEIQEKRRAYPRIMQLGCHELPNIFIASSDLM
jgi:hypothetical protein